LAADNAAQLIPLLYHSALAAVIRRLIYAATPSGKWLDKFVFNKSASLPLANPDACRAHVPMLAGIEAAPAVLASLRVPVQREPYGSPGRRPAP
jgi:hypothetical protein